jgi:hypothetical protein
MVLLCHSNDSSSLYLSQPLLTRVLVLLSAFQPLLTRVLVLLSAFQPVLTQVLVLLSAVQLLNANSFHPYRVAM